MSTCARVRYFLPSVAAMATVAWGILFWMHGTATHHHHHMHRTPLSSAMLFLLSWALMMVAMMLPTTFSFLRLFRTHTANQPDQNILLSLVLMGYLCVWLLFGVGILAVYGILKPWVILDENSRYWAAGLFLIAGAFQFFPLKHHCLTMCRVLPGAIFPEGVGVTARRKSVALGLRHGVACVGCCWALMLLMFAVGSAHLGWMFILAIIMAVEKNALWGRLVAKPLGAVFVLTSALIFVGVF